MITFVICIRIIIYCMDGEEQYFCYYTISSTAELIIQSVLIAVSLLLVGDAFRKFYRMRGSHNDHVTFIYRLLLIWWLIFVASNSFAIIIFTLHENFSGDDGEMSYLTKYYFVVDWLNAYLIQWLLLYLPYQWSKQISDLFDVENSDKRSEVEFVEDNTKESSYKGYETWIFRTLKYYMKFRLVYFILPIVFLPLHHEIGLFKSMVTCLLVDCIFITFSLIFGMYSLKTTEQLKEQLDEAETKRTINQYILVIIANTIRFGFDLAYVISQVFNEETYNYKCPVDHSQDNIGMQIAQNITTVLFTYYLPVFIILRIYHLEDKAQFMCQSLIIHTSETRAEDS